MEGEITPNKPGSASIFCCGRKLEQTLPLDTPALPKITFEEMDTDYFITVDHPMTKMNTGGRLFLYCITQ